MYQFRSGLPSRTLPEERRNKKKKEGTPEGVGKLHTEARKVCMQGVCG